MDRQGDAGTGREGRAFQILHGDKKLYIQSFLSNRPALSRDGLIPAKAPEVAKHALSTVNPQIERARLDLEATYTNRFAAEANKRYR